MYICVYNGVILLYSADWHNIVNQLYSSLKKKKEMSYRATNRNGGNFNAYYQVKDANLNRKKPI